MCRAKFLVSYIRVTGSYRLMKRNGFFFRACEATTMFDACDPLADLNMHRPLGTSHSINHVLLAPAHCLYIFLRRANTGISDINTCSGMTRVYRLSIPNSSAVTMDVKSARMNLLYSIEIGVMVYHRVYTIVL